MTFLKLFQWISGRPAAKKGRCPGCPAGNEEASCRGHSGCYGIEAGKPSKSLLAGATGRGVCRERSGRDQPRPSCNALSALPPRTWLSHLADLELTPADKTALENSVRSLLPRSSAAKLLALNLAGTLRGLLQRCGYKCIASIVVLAVCGLAADTAWYNTGERVILSNETWPIDWTLPDGSIFHGAWRAGFPVTAMRPRNARVTLRYWLAGQGYAKTEVDQDWLIKHSFDHFVAPTGATGAVKAAKRGSL
jgi:hypothetical protein